MNKKIPSIFFLSGPLLGKFFKLRDGSTTLGNCNASEIFIDDKSKSGIHVEIIVSDDRITIKDPSNDTSLLINGEQASSKILEYDDKIQLGTDTTFKLTYADQDELLAINELYESAYNKGYQDGIESQKLKHGSNGK